MGLIGAYGVRAPGGGRPYHALRWVCVAPDAQVGAQCALEQMRPQPGNGGGLTRLWGCFGAFLVGLFGTSGL